MSLLDSVIQFRLDSEVGPLVGTTISRKQSYIAGLLRGLAEKYPGREVHAVYPAGYKP